MLTNGFWGITWNTQVINSTTQGGKAHGGILATAEGIPLTPQDPSLTNL